MTEEDQKALEQMSKSSNEPGAGLKEAASAFEKDLKEAIEATKASEKDEDMEEAGTKGERKFACPSCKKLVKMTVESGE